MDGNNKNLTVLFPGKGYTAYGPLLYYANGKYGRKGYETKTIGYGSYEDFDGITNFVLTQAKEVDFSAYDDILFVSKSLGTVVAGWLVETLGVNVRQILLTPVDYSLPYMKNGKNIEIVIAGTNDPFMDAGKLAEHCKQEQIRLELIEGADHSLEIPGEVNENIDLLKRIVALY